MVRTWIAMLATVGCLAGMPAGAKETRPLDKDFRIFLDMFPGAYDNAEQVAWAEQEGVPADARHERLHHLFLPVDLPAFGQHVFFVQQWLDNDPSKVYRLRLYAFTKDGDENAIRLAIHTPRDQARWIDAHKDPARLAQARPDAFIHRPECDVFWRRRADHFVGEMKPETCRFFSERLGRTVIISDDLLLTRDEIWISDRAVDEDGAYVFGNKAGIPHKNKRVRRFTCFAGIRHQGDPDKWFFKTGLAIHDQGGTLKLVTDEAEPRTFWLRMRRPVWPYGRNDAATTLYVHDAADDGGIGPLISYAWSTYDARRVGLNLMWMQARCQLPEG